MAFKFNPFTGTLDQTGSGGGGSSYIDGEVQNFSALPETLGTPAVDSAYLVREAEGTWLLARKPAGIYIRTDNTGVRADDWTHAGAFPDVFNDANFLLYDNADSTKNLAFQLSGITTGTTRTLTVPDANITLENTGHAAKHATGGSDAMTAFSIGGESLYVGVSQSVYGATTLSAGRAQIYTLNVFSASTITFPTTGTELGDRLVIRGGSPVLATATMSATGVSDTITREGQQLSYVYQNAGGALIWVRVLVDDHDAAAVTTGTFNNARINFAAPPAIGNTTPAAGTFTTLTANTSLTLNGTGAAELINAGAAAGPLNIYNTFTSATNHERGFLKWSSNVFQIGTEKGSGGGTARALEFQTDGVTRMTIGATGPILLSDNNTMEFRTSATKRTTLSTNANGGGLTIAYTSDLAGTSVDSGIFITGGVLRVTGSDSFGYGLRVTGNVLAGNVQSSAFGWTNNGNVGFAFNTGTISVRSAVTVFDLPVLARFGGTTSSFPALKRDTTSLQVRLADDTGFAPLSCGALTLNGNLDASTRDIVTDTTTGTKIGTGTTQLLGFWNATPAAQPAAVADATDAASTQARLNDLLARLRTLGLIAT